MIIHLLDRKLCILSIKLIHTKVFDVLFPSGYESFELPGRLQRMVEKYDITVYVDIISGSTSQAYFFNKVTNALIPP